MTEYPTAGELVAPLAEATDTAIRKARENEGLTILGVVAVSMLVGALLPFGRRRKKPKQAAKTLATSLATSIAELTQTLATQARDHAETLTADARDKLASASHTIGKSVDENTTTLSKQSKKLADDAADQLNDSGKAIARKLVKLIDKARS